jgi:hypothetical protein
VASGSEKVGLNLAFDDAEYPLWVMLRNRGFQGAIHHVTGNSERVDVVVCSPDPQRKLEGYPFSHTFGYYTVLWKERPVFENERPYSALK